MVFEKKNVVLVELRNAKSKNGSELNFVVIADPVTYENYEGMLANDVVASDLSQGEIYNAAMVVRGRFSSLRLEPVGV